MTMQWVISRERNQNMEFTFFKNCKLQFFEAQATFKIGHCFFTQQKQTCSFG
jgi:hypothetical protein